MSIPISSSTAPLVQDVLPAYKITYFYGEDPRAQVYTFARIYALKQDLSLSLYCFERAPTGNLSFVLQGQTHSLLFCLPPQGNGFLTLHPAQTTRTVAAPAKGEALPLPFGVSRFRGEDEQGWYWGAGLLIPRQSLDAAGLCVDVGATFKGALFYHSPKDDAFGCSAPISADGSVLSSGYAQFEVVGY